MDEEMTVEDLAKALLAARGPEHGTIPCTVPWEGGLLYEWVREDFRRMARWLLGTYRLVPLGGGGTMAEGLTEAKLAEIEARANAATPPPWRVLRVTVAYGDAKVGDVIGYDYGPPEDAYFADHPDEDVPFDPGDCNTIFSAHAREDVPLLLAEVRRLREMLDAWVRDVGCECGHGMDRIEREDGSCYFICDWCGASRFR